MPLRRHMQQRSPDQSRILTTFQGLERATVLGSLHLFELRIQTPWSLVSPLCVKARQIQLVACIDFIPTDLAGRSELGARLIAAATAHRARSTQDTRASSQSER